MVEVVREKKAKPASGGPSLIKDLAAKWHIEPEKVVPILTRTAFKQRRNAPPVTMEQMAALLIVADQYGLNPFTGEIKAFPDKQGGIVPFIGIDGWARMINRHPDFDGLEFVPAGEGLAESPKREHPPCPHGMTCLIHRKDLGRPVAITEWFDECYRPPFVRDDGSVAAGPWQSHPKRMLRHKSLIQCARVAFSFVGIYDEDEAERIVEGEAVTVDMQSGADTVMQAIKPAALTEGTSGDAEAAEIMRAANAVPAGEIVDAELVEVEALTDDAGRPIASEDAEP